MTPSQVFVRLPIVTWLQFLYDAGRNAGDDCARRHVLRHDRACAEGVGLAERRPSREARAAINLLLIFIVSCGRRQLLYL